MSSGGPVVEQVLTGGRRKTTVSIWYGVTYYFCLTNLTTRDSSGCPIPSAWLLFGVTAPSHYDRKKLNNNGHVIIISHPVCLYLKRASVVPNQWCYIPAGSLFKNSSSDWKAKWGWQGVDWKIPHDLQPKYLQQPGKRQSYRVRIYLSLVGERCVWLMDPSWALFFFEGDSLDVHGQFHSKAFTPVWIKKGSSRQMGATLQYPHVQFSRLILIQLSFGYQSWMTLVSMILPV